MIIVSSPPVKYDDVTIAKDASGNLIVKDLGITTAKLANLAVATGKIADLAIVEGKIAVGILFKKIAQGTFSAVSSFTIPTLSGNSYKFFKLILEGYYTSNATPGLIYFRPNDSVSCDTRYNVISSAVDLSANHTDGCYILRFATAGAPDGNFAIEVILSTQPGRRREFSGLAGFKGANEYGVCKAGGAFNDTTAEITSIVFYGGPGTVSMTGKYELLGY